MLYTAGDDMAKLAYRQMNYYMIGEGSIWIIIAFTVVSGGVVAWLYIARKKRKSNESGVVDNQDDSNA